MRILLLLCLLCVACDAGGPALTPTPIAPLSFTGSGTSDTARFTLPPGDYQLSWAGDPQPDGTPCVLLGALIAANGIDHGREFGAPDASPRRFNGLSGPYYLSVSGSCAWQITVSPAH